MSEKEFAKNVELVKPSKTKVKIIKFSNSLARAYLTTLEIQEHMFTLRRKDINGQRKVNNSNINVHVEYADLIRMYLTKTSLVLPKNFNDLDGYVERSGFHSVDQWLNALNKYAWRKFDVDENGQKFIDFHVLKVTRIG